MFDQLLHKAIILTAIFTGIPLLCSSCIGLLISFVQAATQIQEQSVQFLVKLAVLSLIIACGWNWAITQLRDMTQEIFSSLTFLGNI